MAFIYLICCDKKAKKVRNHWGHSIPNQHLQKVHIDWKRFQNLFSSPFYTKNVFPPKVCFDQTMISSYGSRWMNSKSKWIGWRIRNCNNARKQILDFSRNLRLTAWTCVAWISFSTSVPPQIQIQMQLMLRFRGSKKAFLVRSSVLWMQCV